MRAIDKNDPIGNSSRASTFVQANIEFEIEASMVINLPSYPNRFVKPKYYNTSIENAAQGIGTYPDYSRTNFITFGLQNDNANAPTVSAVDQTGSEDTEDDIVTRPRNMRPRRNLPQVPPKEIKKL